MKQIIRFAPVIVIALLMASCSKKVKEVVTTDPSTSTATYTNVVQKVNANRNQANQVTGRMSMTLSTGKQKLEVGGNIKIKRNDIIQLSLQVFGFVEAGRLELTPDYILILNRIGKQYVKAAYKDVPFFKENGINFYTFQALLWNELFVPGTDGAVPTMDNFQQKAEGNDVVLTTATKHLLIDFLTQASTGMLQQTKIVPTSGKSKMLCNYKSWARLNSKDFPDKIELGMTINNTDVKAELQLSRLHADDKEKVTRTDIDKKKLKQISMQAAFAQILSLSN